MTDQLFLLQETKKEEAAVVSTDGVFTGFFKRYVFTDLSSHFLPLICDVTAFYPLFQGVAGVSGANPSLSLGEGRVPG